MNTLSTTHPTREQLADFALGKLAKTQAEMVARHLEGCAACRGSAASVPPDSFLGLVRAAPSPSPNAAPSLLPTSASVVGKAAPARATDHGHVPPALATHPKYRIVRELGRGGMGVVYQAEHTVMKTPVALKVVSRALVDNAEAIQRFTQEVQAAARLAHNNIVRALDAEEAGDLHLLVMEFVEGVSLADLVERKGPRPVLYACNYIQQAALGLQHAFEQGMVHRDIKPHNLMLTPKGRVKILDFGLARMARERGQGGGLTADGAFMGTPEYIAPEQATDARTADIRADIYSLGCTLYFLLTGRPPFVEDTPVKLVLAHIEKEARLLHELRKDIPEALSAVVAKMLAKNPADRYQTPIEVTRALAPFVKKGAKGEATPVAPPHVASPGRATVLPNDTGSIPAAKRATPTQSAKASPFAGLSALPTASIVKDKETKKPSPVMGTSKRSHRGGAWKWGLIAGATAAAVLLAGVILFTIRTKDGTLIVETNVPDARVMIDGEQVNVTWDNDGKKAEIRIKPGKHQVEVKKDGFTVHGESVTLEDNGRKVVTAQLEKRPSAPDGFVSLFNGKDLTGWKTHPLQPGDWHVENGILVGSGSAISHLYTERSNFRDFHLRMEVRINSDANSGIFFRSPFGPLHPPKTPRMPLGYEAEIIKKGDGVEVGTLLAGADGVVDRNGSLVAPDEWFSLEVYAEGNRITIKVNGETTVDYTDRKHRYTSGHIALQNHDPETVAEFRKIEIKELPSEPKIGNEQQSSPKRFKAAIKPGCEKYWEVQGNELVQTSMEPEVWILFGDVDWNDYDFSVTFCRVRGDDQVMLGFRCEKEVGGYLFGLGTFRNHNHTIEGFGDAFMGPAHSFASARAGLLRNNQEYTATVTVRGDRAELWLDKHMLHAFKADKRSNGMVGLRTWDSVVRFKNIKVTAPDGTVLFEGLPEL